MILISGGGTGGHIFPAIAIAQELGVLRSDLHFQFVGALGKMEMEKVPKAGYPIIGLPISAFHRRITWKNLLFPYKLLRSMYRARQIITQFKPILVIGTGGFASGPLLRAAAGKSIPILVQEQNAFPGVTNRLICQKAEVICVAHDGLEKWFPKEKIRFTGNPVRKDLSDIENKFEEGLREYGFDQDSPVVLVFGGSLGALALNQAMEANLESLGKASIQVIWQTGPSYFPVAKARLEEAGIQNIHAYPFLERMDLAYAAARIVICRAGAITLSELAIAAKPCILVPYPSAAGNHQMKNAESFRDKGAAIIVENQHISAELFETLSALLNDKGAQQRMKINLKKLAKPEAGQLIAREALKIIEKQKV